MKTLSYAETKDNNKKRMANEAIITEPDFKNNVSLIIMENRLIHYNSKGISKNNT